MRSIVQGSGQDSFLSKSPWCDGQRDVIKWLNELYRSRQDEDAHRHEDSKEVDLYYNRELSPEDFTIEPIIKEKFLDDHIRLERFDGVIMAVMPQHAVEYDYDLPSWAARTEEATGAAR